MTTPLDNLSGGNVYTRNSKASGTTGAAIPWTHGRRSDSLLVVERGPHERCDAHAARRRRPSLPIHVADAAKDRRQPPSREQVGESAPRWRGPGPGAGLGPKRSTGRQRRQQTNRCTGDGQHYVGNR